MLSKYFFPLVSSFCFSLPSFFFLPPPLTVTNYAPLLAKAIHLSSLLFLLFFGTIIFSSLELSIFCFTLLSYVISSPFIWYSLLLLCRVILNLVLKLDQITLWISCIYTFKIVLYIYIYNKTLIHRHIYTWKKENISFFFYPWIIGIKGSKFDSYNFHSWFNVLSRPLIIYHPSIRLFFYIFLDKLFLFFGEL